MNKKEPNYKIRSIRKAIHILNSLGREKEGLTLAELTKKLNISKSTIFRILLNLKDEEFVSKEKCTNKYYLGNKIFELGESITQDNDLRKITFPFMKELKHITKESISLDIRYDEYRVAIEKVDSTLMVRHVVELGKPIPLFAGAAGKVILAFLSNEEMIEIINRTNFTKFAANTIIDSAQLLKELKKIKKEGYATSFEELIPDSASIAVAILNKNEKVIASLCIAGPISRFKKKEKITFYASLLKEISEKISSKLDFIDKIYSYK